MDLQLRGKRALITGSTTGSGAAIALRLAAEGATVLIHGRRAEAVNKLIDQIAAAGGQATGALGDLTTETGVRQVVAAALGSGGTSSSTTPAAMRTAPGTLPPPRTGWPGTTATSSRRSV